MAVVTHGQNHAAAVEAILQDEIANEGGDKRARQIARIIDGREPARLGDAEPGLLLHQRQQRRVGETRHAKRQDQAENARAKNLVAIESRRHRKSQESPRLQMTETAAALK